MESEIHRLYEIVTYIHDEMYYLRERYKYYDLLATILTGFIQLTYIVVRLEEVRIISIHECDK
jgi:hypothetical protein